ncbi:MAG: hypothetical protein A2X86_09415 [Bdellovibrionales bacterium GWA2_49_15]|nr:MAG: hypothetical protein A2X86_09415 [Bdellovibrionales bacterium GWA2_49_15]HAZ12997.1 hypothetical protein [Bdellovibrionales bacterium]
MNRKVLGLLFAISLIISLIYFLRLSENHVDQVNEVKSVSTVQVPKISQSNEVQAPQKMESPPAELEKTMEQKSKVYDKDLQEFLARRKKAVAIAKKWQAVLNRQPDNPEALGNLGYAFIGLVKWEEAARLAEKCLDLDSKNELCHTVRYFATDNLDTTSVLNDLLPLLEECLTAIPGHYRCLSEIVQNFIMANKLDKAEEYLLRLEKFHPDKILTLYRRSMYYLALKDYDRTRTYLRKTCAKKGLDSFIAADYVVKDVACSQLATLKDYH